jgi:arginine exporter protein ArgO
MEQAMATSISNSNHRGFAETAVQKGSLIVGIVFLLVGILGFIPGITTNMDTLQFAGHESDALLLGVFQVSILHNLVHLLFGVAGIALARSASASKKFLIWGGAIYAVLWLYGLFIDHDSMANFVPLNTADNWLHFVLAVGMIALGVLLPRLGRRTTNRAA